jgi:16S rRNA (cytosine967-C5)-methyltransferase
LASFRHLSQLDFFIAQLREGRLDEETQAILRLGLYQLFHMRVPSHAVVNESVSLAGRSRGLVNAILRRATREHAQLEHALASASLRCAGRIRAFSSTAGSPRLDTRKPRRCVHGTTDHLTFSSAPMVLRTTADELAATAAVTERVSFHPRVLKVSELPPAWLTDGLVYVQDPSTLLACDLLDPQPARPCSTRVPHRAVKPAILAELMGNEGRIVAADLWGVAPRTLA